MTITEKSFEKYLESERKLSPDIEALYDKPFRNPCKYCNTTHVDVACDKQIELIKILLEVK